MKIVGMGVTRLASMLATIESIRDLLAFEKIGKILTKLADKLRITLDVLGSLRSTFRIAELGLRE